MNREEKIKRAGTLSERLLVLAENDGMPYADFILSCILATGSILYDVSNKLQATDPVLSKKLNDQALALGALIEVVG